MWPFGSTCGLGGSSPSAQRHLGPAAAPEPSQAQRWEQEPWVWLRVRHQVGRGVTPTSGAGPVILQGLLWARQAGWGCPLPLTCLEQHPAQDVPAPAASLAQGLHPPALCGACPSAPPTLTLASVWGLPPGPEPVPWHCPIQSLPPAPYRACLPPYRAWPSALPHSTGNAPLSPAPPIQGLPLDPAPP
ncbi:hypothetical protein KIL84_005931 [Mauremys mutica]|uniref:Uncharacterized protein n=1 Tax=Mauremys mutica TaxID=74926 RepID=A0A9D4B485_9SAUR|nr:hypothetical protein KIL84_005931 [Mauremys mutica]